MYVWNPTYNLFRIGWSAWSTWFTSPGTVGYKAVSDFKSSQSVLLLVLELLYFH